MVKLCFPIVGIPNALPSFLRAPSRKRKKRGETISILLQAFYLDSFFRENPDRILNLFPECFGVRTSNRRLFVSDSLSTIRTIVRFRFC